MGGPGSGQWYRWHKKDAVEEHRNLDVNRWLRDGLLKPGYAFGWNWWRDGEKTASLGVSTFEGAVELSYTIRPRTPEAADIRYRVALTWTPCTYGGRRPWFVCPGVTDGRACGRRVAKLYIAGRYFLCRRCQGLTYESQREDEANRARTRAQNIRRRLGGDPSLITPLPPKPKWMRWRTYERLRQEALDAELESWVALKA